MSKPKLEHRNVYLNLCRQQEVQQNNEDVLEKINNAMEKMEIMENKVIEINAANEDLSRKLEEHKALNETKIESLAMRIQTLENEVLALNRLPGRIKELEEKVEERTNRQLRETLVFKNLPEESADETYDQTKDLLAKTISDTCKISFEEVRSEIKRAHREAKRPQNRREGKRLIYAAFHSWDLCQDIIATFRMKGVKEANFNIFAEQKYGPITMKRRNLALQKRKELKDSGTISGGFVAFPAKLMVNFDRELNSNGKKVYRLHSDFSSHEIV